MTTLQKEEVRYFYEDEVKNWEILFKKDCEIDLKKYNLGNILWMIFFIYQVILYFYTKLINRWTWSRLKKHLRSQGKIIKNRKTHLEMSWHEWMSKPCHNNNGN